MIVFALVIFKWKDTNIFELLSFGVSVSQEQSESTVLGARYKANSEAFRICESKVYLREKKSLHA
jgi:hypothetical protein